MSAIGAKLNTVINEHEWSVDLSSPDKTLEVKADVSEKTVIDAVASAGFKAEPIG